MIGNLFSGGTTNNSANSRLKKRVQRVLGAICDRARGRSKVAPKIPFSGVTMLTACALDVTQWIMVMVCMGDSTTILLVALF
mgnify:CR=1 FL=1